MNSRQRKKRGKNQNKRLSLPLCLRDSPTSNKLSSKKVRESLLTNENLGEDPKSVLCAYFKAGVCEKGKRCKFSHDLGLDGKAAKIDLYSDPRDKAGKPAERTDITCTHFIDAVEKNLYGWLWECPNGGEKCVYTHALPIGYVLEREKKEAAKLALEDDEDEKTIEEIIEEERAALPAEGMTPVTLESFHEWKKQRQERRQKELEKKAAEEAKKGSKG